MRQTVQLEHITYVYANAANVDIKLDMINDIIQAAKNNKPICLFPLPLSSYQLRYAPATEGSYLLCKLYELLGKTEVDAIVLD